MFVHKLLLGAAFVAFSWMTVVPERASPTTGPATTKPNTPLKLEISAVPLVPGTVPTLRVTVENTSDRDVVVNLGMMLANGKKQLPVAVSLVLTDTAGKSKRLQWRPFWIGGRVDDYLVPLRAGSAYTLRLKLDDYWSPETKEFPLKLEPGEYSVRAELDAKSIQHVNSDMSGVTLINLWTGQVQSEVTRFRVPKPNH